MAKVTPDPLSNLRVHGRLIGVNFRSKLSDLQAEPLDFGREGAIEFGKEKHRPGLRRKIGAGR